MSWRACVCVWGGPQALQAGKGARLESLLGRRGEKGEKNPAIGARRPHKPAPRGCSRRARARAGLGCKGEEGEKGSMGSRRGVSLEVPWLLRIQSGLRWGGWGSGKTLGCCGDPWKNGWGACVPPAWQGAPLGGIPLGGCVWVECARPELFLPEWPGHYGTHPLGTHARTPPFFGGATHRGRAVERGGKNPEKKKRKKMLPPPCLPASGEAPAPGWGPLFWGGTLCGLALQSLLSPLPGVAHLETLAGLGSGWLMIETPAPGSSQHLLPKSWGDPAVPPTNTHIHTSTFHWPLCSRRPAARRWRLSSFPGRTAHGARRTAQGLGHGKWGSTLLCLLNWNQIPAAPSPRSRHPFPGKFFCFPSLSTPSPRENRAGDWGAPHAHP